MNTKVLIGKPSDFDQDILEAFYKFRKRVFMNHLKWSLTSELDMEIDDYDNLNCFYAILINDNNNIQGGYRFIPTNKPYLIRDKFRDIINRSVTLPQSKTTWEITRFFSVTPDNRQAKSNMKTLMSTMLELGLSQDVDKFIIDTDNRMLISFQNLNWPFETLSESRRCGKREYTVGLLDCSRDVLHTLKTKMQTVSPTLLS